jgi:hypothetical protein
MIIKTDTFEGIISKEIIDFDKSIVDNIERKTLDINVKIVDSGKTFIFPLREIPYVETWEDADLIDLIWEALKEFETES